ncbi:MAG TPA: VWA domain-containing protein [Polyangiaceae bacterium]|jgi:Ca-activated chloride channel family protein|nr:VWA domain-containing protein [Polyangiaceae bacterium]
MKRLALLTAFLIAAVLLGAAYPAFARGPELLHAQWQYPWLLLGLALVPPLLWRGSFGEDARRPRLLLGTVSGFSGGPVGMRVWLRDVPAALRAVGFALLVLSLGRPLNAVVPQSAEEEGIDLVLVLDLSGSMRAVIENFPEDLARLAPERERGVRPTRLDAAKATIRDFVSRRKTDRIGVVVFGKSAYVLSPPTLDYHLLDSLVSRLRLDLIDASRTAIGDALGVATARLRRSQAKSKAIILLTDGDNNAGELSPEYAAHLATVVGARIYTVQIGAGDQAEVQDGFDLFGQPRYSTRFFPVNAQLLQTISKATGGESYVASDAKGLQASLHDVLDKLEKTKFEGHVATFEDLYRYLLLPGVLLLALDAALRALILRRFP